MTCMETCIVILVIGLVATLFALAVLDKIFNERKKSADKAGKVVTDTISKGTEAVLNVYKQIIESENKREQELKETYENEMNEIKRKQEEINRRMSDKWSVEWDAFNANEELRN